VVRDELWAVPEMFFNRLGEFLGGTFSREPVGYVAPDVAKLRADFPVDTRTCSTTCLPTN